MTDIHDRARASAIRMLAPRPAGKGIALTLRVTASGTYAPGGDGAIGATTDYAGSGIRTAYKLSDVDGSIVQQGDVKFILSPDGIPTPAPGNLIVFDGETFTVVACNPWNYAGVVCGHTVQARK